MEENNEVKTGRIETVNIDRQMRSAYIDYSMSVIVSRALPDVRDGLKPVHRRVLFGMEGLGLSYTGQTKKSARIVGEVLRLDGRRPGSGHAIYRGKAHETFR